MSDGDNRGRTAADAEEAYRRGERLLSQSGDADGAVRLFRQAAAQGSADAQYALGACYHEGVGVGADPGEAARWWLEAARRGHVDAQYNLGTCYYNGSGVEEDGVRALGWFQMAAEQGDANAQNAVGICYEDGVGTGRNHALAVAWWRKAAAQGHAGAQAQLGDEGPAEVDEERISAWSADYTEEYVLHGACGRGGEGATYHVEGQPGMLAKIYSPEALIRRFPDVSGGRTWTMQEKVSHMVAVAPRLSLAADDGSGDEHLVVAWPVATLFDGDGRFAGFLMPKVSSSLSDDLGTTDLHYAYRPRERKYLFGGRYTWMTAIAIAINLASAVERLHENDVVIGDFNCNNILVDSCGRVTLIDADSFCIRNDFRQVTYRCVVATGDFLAPELQGIDFASSRSRRTFTRESDCFSLAIHVFMLLMNGTHPFAGVKAGMERRASSSTEPYVSEIAAGECPYVTGSRLAPFAGTPQISRFPYYIRILFDRAFGYASPDGKVSAESISDRPTAREWREALERLRDECSMSPARCPVDETHCNLPGSYTCMWCELEGRLVPLGDDGEDS